MLKLENVKKSYGSKQVLRGIDMDVRPGQIVGLIGKNGSGKTTIFYTILNFIQYQGKVRLGGDKIQNNSFDKIGYLPEERSLIPRLTVWDQVRYLAELKGLSKEQISSRLPKWMERFQVKGNLDDKIKSLSKGNQQKVQLIATLIHEPDLVILDEPFSGLDPVNTALLKEVILAEKARGAAIIFSDHVMTNVEEICDEVIMIDEGAVVINGAVQSVRNSFGRTRLFISSDWSKEELENLPHVIQVTKTNQETWRLVLDDEKAGPELFKHLTQGEYIQTFNQQPPTIDEIFKMKLGVTL